MDQIGDLARALVLRNNQVRLRDQMDRLAVETATGLVKDAGRHLGGDIGELLSIDRSLSRLDAYRINTTEAGIVTSTMQTALDEIQTRGETMSQSLLSAELTPSPELLNTFSNTARDALGETLNALNRSAGGRFLFSGTATDTPAMPGLNGMMTELRTAAAGATDLAGLTAAVDAFFAPGGQFETGLYAGSDTGLAPLRLSETETANLDIRATNPAFREILKPMASAALAADPALGLDLSVQVAALSKAGSDLLAAQKPMVEMRAGLGALEARVEESATRNASQRTALQIAKSELVGADQYETASRYENARSQLESLYAITARSQRLSLSEFL